MWSNIDRIILSTEHKNGIIAGEKLDDLVIDTAQHLLKRQFPGISGLQSTLLQAMARETNGATNQLQIIHSRGDHWIVTSTLLPASGAVNVYDSIYSTLNKETRTIIRNLFGPKSVRSIPIPKQMGGQDCGVYSIAIATALAFNQDPATVKFRQSALRSHLVECITTQKLSPFPLFK